MKSSHLKAFTPLLMAACLAPLAFAPAHAQVQLRWNNCYGMPSASVNQDYACDGSRTGLPFKLVMSFTSPVNLPAFVGIEGQLAITALPDDGADPAQYPLPDFWRINVGECRDGYLQFPQNGLYAQDSMPGFGSGPSGPCPNPWSGPNTYTGGGMAVWGEVSGKSRNYTTPWPGHMLTHFAFARSTARALTGGQLYLGGVFNVHTDKDVDLGDGTCAGCATPMRFTLVRSELYQTAHSEPQDIYPLEIFGPSNEVTWQSGSQTVPVKRSTWGAIKSTYR
jgi:hypothetical protein